MHPFVVINYYIALAKIKILDLKHTYHDCAGGHI